jgi:hypothetical protein
MWITMDFKEEFIHLLSLDTLIATKALWKRKKLSYYLMKIIETRK